MRNLIYKFINRVYPEFFEEENNNLKYIINKHKIKIKFLLVGVWNTLFGFVLFVVLYKLFSNVIKINYFAYTSAQILGKIISILNAYIFHKYITFKSILKGKEMLIEFFKFSTTYIVLFIVGLILMPFLVEVLKIKPIIAYMLQAIIVISTSYFGHSRFSFRKKDNVD
jgi:putative flippase GtrA